MYDGKLFNNELYEDIIKFIVERIMDEIQKHQFDFNVENEPVNWADLSAFVKIVKDKESDIAVAEIEEVSPFATTFRNVVTEAYLSVIDTLKNDIDIFVTTEW